MEQVYKATENLSNAEFAAAVGDARLRKETDRSELDKVLVKCEAQLKTMRCRADRIRALIREVGAETPPPLPFRHFVGFDSSS